MQNKTIYINVIINSMCKITRNNREHIYFNENFIQNFKLTLVILDLQSVDIKEYGNKL